MTESPRRDSGESEIWKPPTMNGIGASSVALPDGTWATAIDFLEWRFPTVPRTEWLARMERGAVVDWQGAAVSPTTPYQPCTKIHYYRHIENEQRIPFDETVLFQDELLVVADKPHFLPVIPTGRYLQETLLVRLKRRLRIDTLVPLHRIDRDTAGLVMFTVQPATRDRYAALFRKRRISKFYEAIASCAEHANFPLTYRSRIVEGDPYIQMREAAGEANAETTVELLETRGRFARYGLTPITGKRHQLRVQLSALGIPIVNDRFYPTMQPHSSRDDYSKPLQLLAKTLEFADPISGQRREFESRLQLSF